MPAAPLHPRAPLACLLAALAAGCIPRDRAGFDAVGPAHRLDAVVLAADASDRESLRGLIQTLDSDDPAARLLAIRALQKRTGQTLGYRYTDPPWRRAPAIQEWIDWERGLDNGAPPEAAADAGADTGARGGADDGDGAADARGTQTGGR